MNRSWLHIAAAIAICISACNNNKSTNTSIPAAYRLPAVAGLTEEISKDPGNAALYFNRGVVLNDIQEDSLALNDFKKAISLDSAKAPYYSAIGDLLFEHKDISGSVQWFEKALKLNPADPVAHLKMAKMFIYTKDYTAAFKEINIVLRQDVYNPEGYFLKGLIYKDLRDTAKAISSFQTAVQVAPAYKDAIIQLGLLFSARHDPIALKYFDNAFKADTTDLFPVYAKGVYYQDSKDYERAKQEYKNVIRQDREYSDAYLNLGYVLMQQDSTEKAWKQFDILTQIDPANADGYYNRGVASEMMGKKDEAKADFKQALVFDPQYADAKAALARVGN